MLEPQCEEIGGSERWVSGQQFIEKALSFFLRVEARSIQELDGDDALGKENMLSTINITEATTTKLVYHSVVADLFVDIAVFAVHPVYLDV